MSSHEAVGNHMDGEVLALTSEEEERLLAEFGTESIFDSAAGIDLAALRHKFGANREAAAATTAASVTFLTGTSVTERDTERLDRPRESDDAFGDGASTHAAGVQHPLSSVVFRQTSVSNVGTSMCLLASLSTQLSAASQQAIAATARRRKRQLKHLRKRRAFDVAAREEELESSSRRGPSAEAENAVDRVLSDDYLAECRFLDAVVADAASSDSSSGDDNGIGVRVRVGETQQGDLEEILLLAEIEALRALEREADTVVAAPRVDLRTNAAFQQELSDLNARLARQLWGDDSANPGGCRDVDVDLSPEEIRALIVDSDNDDGAGVLGEAEIAVLLRRHGSGPAISGEMKDETKTSSWTEDDVAEIAARAASEESRLTELVKRRTAENAARDRIAASTMAEVAASAIRDAGATAATTAVSFLEGLHEERERQLRVGGASLIPVNPPSSLTVDPAVGIAADDDVDALFAVAVAVDESGGRVQSEPHETGKPMWMRPPRMAQVPPPRTSTLDLIVNQVLPPLSNRVVATAAARDEILSGGGGEKKQTARAAAASAARAAFTAVESRLEARERRAMLVEDSAAARHQRRFEVARAEQAARRTALEADEDTARRAQVTLAAVAWSDVAERERRQRTSIERWAAHKAAQRVLVAIEGVVEAETAEREEIAQLALASRSEIVALAAVESSAREAAQQARARAAIEAAQVLVGRLRGEFLHRWSEIGVQALSSLRRAGTSVGPAFATNGGDGRCLSFPADEAGSVNVAASWLPVGANTSGLPRSEDDSGARGERAFVTHVSFSPRARVLVTQLGAKQDWLRYAEQDVIATLRALSAELSLSGPLAAAVATASAAPPIAGSTPQHPSQPQSQRAPPSGRKRASLTAALRASTPVDDAGGEDCWPSDSGTNGSGAVTPNEYATGNTAGSDLEANVSGERVLGTALVRKLHAHHPLVFRWGLQSLSGLIDTIAANVEDITGIDFAGLASGLRLDRSVPVAPLITSVDLGGNLLKSVDAALLLATFPSLRRLSLSDNRLVSVLLPPPASANVNQAASPSLSSSSSRSYFAAPGMTHLQLNSNKLQSLHGIGQFPALLSLQVFSNVIDSAAPLEACPRLAQLEINRNNLKDLGVLSKLPLLLTLDASRNAIESLSGLTHNVLLQQVFLSSNALKELPTRLPTVFLRTLFLNDNGLAKLPELSWLPFLSTLSVESNRLVEIRGVTSCPMLSTLRLAFNQIATTDALFDLASCKRLTTVSLTDNPIASTPNAQRLCRIFLLHVLPVLREVDNEGVTKHERVDAQKLLYYRELQPTLALAMRLPLVSFLNGASTPGLSHARSAAMIGGGASRGSEGQGEQSAASSLHWSTLMTVAPLAQAILPVLHPAARDWRAAVSSSCGTAPTTTSASSLARDRCSWINRTAASMRLSALSEWWSRSWSDDWLSTQTTSTALGLDAELFRLQAQQEWLESVQNRTFNDARSLEERRLQRLRERGGIVEPATTGSASDAAPAAAVGRRGVCDPHTSPASADLVWLTNRQRQLVLLQRHVQVLRNPGFIAGSAGTGPGSSSSQPAHSAASSTVAVEGNATSVTSGGDGGVVAVHVVSLQYARREILYREENARRRLSRWVCSRFRVRQAQKTVRLLRESSAAFRLQRLAAAARRIQPLWRGAWTRMRLRRAGLGLEDLGDNDDDLKPMSFDEPAMPNVGRAAIATLLGATLQGSVKVPAFCVRPMLRSGNGVSAVASTPSVSLRGGSASATLRPAGYGIADPFDNGASPSSSLQALRPNSVPQSLDHRAANANNRLVPTTPDGTPGPRPHVKAAFPSPQQLQQQPTAQPSSVDEAWGAAVTAQIRKRDKKQERARAEQSRKDFLADPLKARK